MENKFYAMLGFAAKAGKCAYGATACEKTVKAGTAFLVLFDEGLSERSKKDLRNMCAYYEVEWIEVSPAGQMGKAVGRETKIIAIKENGFAARLSELGKKSEV